MEDSASEQRACARADLSMSYDTDGRFQLRYSAPATIDALVEQAVKEAKDALFLRRRDTNTDTAAAVESRPGVEAARYSQDPGAGLPTYADALEEMATRSLAAIPSTSRASRYRVYLHLSTDGAWVGGGPAIPLRLLGRFITDGKVQPVWETEGRPVSVGRSMRILPDRTRRLIHDRDRGCRFPGCPTTRFVEIHHLHPWDDGGATDEHHQASLCTIHHDALDRGDYTITGDPTHPDGLTVTNRHGLPIRPPQPKETAPPPGGDPPIHANTYHPPSGGPIRWTDLELPPDTDPPPDTDLPTHTPPGTQRLAPLPNPQPLTPQQRAELQARLTQEWQDQVAANRNPLIRRNY
ncbi:MAG: HNH endonuclease [Pedococcus sp.]